MVLLWSGWGLPRVPCDLVLFNGPAYAPAHHPRRQVTDVVLGVLSPPLGVYLRVAGTPHPPWLQVRVGVP